MSQDSKFSGYIGYITGVTDDYHAERVKAVISIDKGKPLSKIPYAFPLMPKMLHVKPKIGEAVIVLIPNEGQPNEQRYYIGPIISEPSKMFFDSFATLSATRFLNGGLSSPNNSVDNNPITSKTLPKDDEIALLGRNMSDIILGDDDIRLRCGVRTTGTKNNQLTDKFLRTAPAFIKLKYNETPIETEGKKGEISPHTTTLSTATIVADKINLISPNGDGGFSLTGEGEAITDEKMKEILERAHKLPYGDVLCDLLSQFLKMFQEHVHAYPGLPPVVSPNAETFWGKYSPEKNDLENKLLSKDIAIN